MEYKNIQVKLPASLDEQINKEQGRLQALTGQKPRKSELIVSLLENYFTTTKSKAK